MASIGMMLGGALANALGLHWLRIFVSTPK